MTQHDIIASPVTLTIKVRLLAAELAPRQGTVRAREIRRAAGRLAEDARCASAERWQAIKLEDDFKRAVYARLRELDALAGKVAVARNVIPFHRREGAAA